MKIESRVWTHSDNIDEKTQRPVAARVSRPAGKMRRESSIKYPLLLALAACILAFCGCAEEASSATAKPVETPVEVNAVHPHRGEVSRFINLPGEVRPLYEVTLFAKVDGYLEKLTVDKGDSVKAGDLIADIDVPELRANLVKYKAELELAQAEFKQMSEATAGDSEATKNRLAVASGKLAVAKSNVQYTESMLKYARVVAPFGGIITKRYVDPGAYIPVPNAASTPEAAAIVNLTDFKTVRLQVAVPETEATHVKIGQSIRWTADDFPGEHFDGTVTRAYWALDKATKTMLTETQIANPGMKLQPGMLVNARIGIEKKNDALLLPAGALVKEKTNSFIFIFNDGKIKKAPVEVGFNDGTNVEIVAGVKPADLAIVPGQQALRDGQLVKVTEEKLVKVVAAK
jgi:RND family efflux transporter MFP subunit